MNKKSLFLLLIFLIAFTLVLGAYGFLKKDAARRRSSQTEKFEKETLQLTVDQNISKEVLHKKMCADIQPLREKSRQKRLELMQLISQETIDRESIDAKLKEISQIQYDMQLRMVDHLVEMKTILTPEQQKRFFDTMCAGLCGESECSHPSKKGGKCCPKK